MFTILKKYIIGDQFNVMESFHDKARYNLLYNIATLILILGLMATIISLIIGTYPVLVPGLGNVLFALLTLFLMQKGKLQLAAKVYFFVLFCLLFGNLIFNDGTMHIGSPFWVMLLNILVIYILGMRWGFAYLAASVFAFAYYIVDVLPHTIEIVNHLPKATYYSAVYETLFALLILGYTINIILNASRESDKMLRERNAELTEQNQIIHQHAEDKTVLLKEIHHRVKNNLQLIISMMRLQMNELDECADQSQYMETINRIMTMAMIHEKLYQSDELSKVNIERYFNDLSQDLMKSYQLDKEIRFESSFELEKVGMKTLIPIALIFNELFSNSVKHAFENCEHPEISYSLRRQNDQSLILEYCDNGLWKERQSYSSFGLELIDSLVDQLDGEMYFESSPRTYYRLRFRDLDY